MSIDWKCIYAELKGWQSGLGALLGFGAIIVGALFNAHLNRKRDTRLRLDEAIAVASALYGEIIILRKAVAQLANAVAHRYVENGMGRLREEPFDRHFIEQFALPPLTLYSSLAAKVGLLPNQIALGIVRFYARVEEVRIWLPRLQTNGDRPFTYGVNYVLNPAIDAVTGVASTLELIKDFAQIAEPVDTPKIKDAVEAQDIEKMQYE